MNTSRVSIVIPSYNHAHFLGKALDSVRAQTMADWECVVVNNYSTDATEEVVNGYGDPRIRLVNFRNQGVIAASRNVGIRETTAEWVAFLDSDDWWEADKLERCLAVAGQADVIAHPELHVLDGVVVGQGKVATPERVTYRALLFQGNCLSPSGILVRRTWLEQVGGFDTASELVTAEDFDLWLRLVHAGARVVSVGIPLGSFRVHAGQNSANVQRHESASLAVLARHLDILGTTGLLDRLRGRRARGLAIYAAGRTLQKGGEYRQALGKFLRAALWWPCEPRLLAAMALSLLRRG